MWTGFIWLRIGQFAGSVNMGIGFLYILGIFEYRGIISLSRSTLLHGEVKKVQTKPLGISVRGFLSTESEQGRRSGIETERMVIVRFNCKQRGNSKGAVVQPIVTERGRS